MKQYYNHSVEEVSKEFQTDAERGLSPDEIASRLEKYGKNMLIQKKGRPFIVMFLEQFKSFLIILLIIAAVISGVMGVRTGEGLLDTYIIMGILLLNAFIGAYQEYQAQKSMDALKKMEDVVPGDVVVLEVGDIVPADIRITESVNMSIQESSMTGESVPVEKSPDTIAEKEVPLGDRKNMAFSSGVVTFGRGKGIVVGTGMNTEIGKIAGMLNRDSDTQTPMQVRLEKLGKVIGIASILICVVIFIIGVLYGRDIIGMFMVAVSLAVAAIPEGLPWVCAVWPGTTPLSASCLRWRPSDALLSSAPTRQELLPRIR